MASSTLDAVVSGTKIFVDAPIFIYHFSGSSPQCRAFLERCELGEINASTSAVTLAEVAHRLMTIEAVATGKVSPGNVVKKLRSRPEVVRELHVYQEQIEKIPLMGIEVEPLDLATLLASAELRNRHGFLTNDSLAAATIEAKSIGAIATADRNFERLGGVDVFRPTDI